MVHPSREWQDFIHMYIYIFLPLNKANSLATQEQYRGAEQEQPPNFLPSFGTWGLELFPVCVGRQFTAEQQRPRQGCVAHTC